MPAKANKNEGWTAVRFRSDLMENAQRLADELGPIASASMIVNQMVEEYFGLLNSDDRRVPRLVRAVDGVRSEGAPLVEEAPPRRSERAGSVSKTLHVGKG